MSDSNTNSSPGTNQPIPVSPDNPCPFLRGLVGNGYVDGHTVTLQKLTGTIEAASGETGLKERIAGGKVYLVALIANGLNPLRVFKSWWSGQASTTAQRATRQTWRRLAYPWRRRSGR